jgi:hypothetical protein
MSATNRGSKRLPLDDYPTPAWLSRAIVPVLKQHFFEQKLRILEPCAGSGKMVEVLKEEFPTSKITSWDLKRDKIDFLKQRPRPGFDLIITNPPFGLAQEVITHAMKFRCTDAPHLPIVAMLLRVSFLGSRKRAKWLRANTPTDMYVTPRRPTFVRGTTDNCEYAWFLWTPLKTQTIGILDTEDGHD